MIPNDQLKLLMAAVLFFVWIALVQLQVPNDQDLISFCKEGLYALGAYHVIRRSPPPPPPPPAPLPAPAVA